MSDISPLPAFIEAQITTPHSHEGDGRAPLWLVWKRRKLAPDGVPSFPELDTVCDTPLSARYHVTAVLADTDVVETWIERIPANHRFASSLDAVQMRAHYAMWKWRQAHAGRTGD